MPGYDNFPPLGPLYVLYQLPQTCLYHGCLRNNVYFILHFFCPKYKHCVLHCVGCPRPASWKGLNIGCFVKWPFWDSGRTQLIAQYLYVPVCACVFVCVCCLCLCVCVYVSLYVCCMWVFVSVYIPVCICLCICFCMCMSGDGQSLPGPCLRKQV